MHVPFEAGLGWIHLAHKNADMLLLISIASLGLLPLVSIYIIETEKYEETATLASPRTTSEFLRSSMRCLVYMAILFPYLLALLSTYVSIQLIRGQSLDEEGDGTQFPYGDETSPKATCNGATMFWLYYRNTKVLEEDDRVVCDTTKETTTATSATDTLPVWWKLPLPESQNTIICDQDAADHGPVALVEADKNFRLVTEDCAICMHPYHAGERIVWSSNPSCIHCYHFACLQAWMEPWDARSKRCPCCRQSFVNPQQ
ncbi:NADPH Oxidase [Seminavis robusta]|uniref:NADPH Oxidase n=1 Tax=Seminavis robusta TaxID=568900 RepID=A0A9N8H5D1_9STRA|nr:NADPH Oxidase [Seminavis robusta]|eukprot:Sro71_g039590.1 NADPH Oxidase (258) ;mRNA; r:118443-119293